MASFMKNWWDKHDMDRDGKGCALGCLAVVAAVGAVGVCLGIIGAVVVFKFIL